VDSKVAATKAANLYRLHPVEELQDVFEEHHLNGRTAEDVDLDGLPALLLHGELGNEQPSWLGDVELLVGVRPVLRSGSAGACLTWAEEDGSHWALTWGAGFHFLRASSIEQTFAPRVLVRAAESASVKSLTKTILDYRSRVDRSTIPAGDSIAALGVEGYGEVVSKIEARMIVPSLTLGNKAFTARAGEALYLPLGKTASNLRADVQVLRQVERSSIRPGLEAIEQLKALRPTDGRLGGLTASLTAALENQDPHALSLSWPHDRLRLDGEPEYMKIWLPGSDPIVVPGVITLDGLFECIEQWRGDGRSTEDLLDAVQIELFNDEGCRPPSAVSRKLSLRTWLAFEVPNNDERFCLYDGRWFQMDQDYLERIDQAVSDIFSTQPLVALSPWQAKYKDEDAYNKALAKDLTGIVMDKKLIRTDLHTRGIEVCDVFVPGSALVHVKRAESSASVSHLLAQGLVSADSLRRDEKARAEFRTRANRQASRRLRKIEWKQVIFGLARERPIDASSLFSFSKVNLVRQVQFLRSFSIDVAVAHIPRVGDAEPT
jgi:uncharacterized protein (TIGR04141 family)